MVFVALRDVAWGVARVALWSEFLGHIQQVRAIMIGHEDTHSVG